MLFKRVNGVTLCYSLGEAGADLPWLVFVNSLGTDHRIWDDVRAKLGTDFNTLAYDKRGHGLSDAAEAPYAMADHIGDLDALLDAQDISRAAICGASVGGMIAMGLAARRADLVSALVLMDTGHRIGDVDTWNARNEAVRSRGVAGISDSVLQRWFTEEYRSSNPAFAGFRNMLERTSVEGYTGTVAALRDTDYTDLARGLKLPTLCLVGDADEATPPALVEELSSLIEGAEFKTVANAGHQPQIERSDEVAQTITEFLNRQAHG